MSEELWLALWQQLAIEIKAATDPKSGCPWLKNKSFQDLAPYTLEEAYELVDAVEKNDDTETCAELADLYLHLILYVQLAERQHRFTLEDVLKIAVEKQQQRRDLDLHQQQTPAEAKDYWEEKKRAALEKSQSLLDNIPNNMPALLRSKKIQDRVGHVGFDWNTATEVLSVLKDEISELEEGIIRNNKEEILDELGDVLFTCVNVARHLDVDPEQALRYANKKFTRRFQYIENILREKNKKIKDFSFDELLLLWEEAKQQSDSPH